MGVAKFKSSAPRQSVPTPVEIQRVETPSILVDNKYIPASSLLAYVEGSSWIVEYFYQTLANGSEVRTHDETQVDIYQQYRHIRGLELKVTSALSASQDESSKRMTVTGTANVYPFIVPNVGDMFLAPVGDGNDGIFTVTASERMSYRADAVYTINYTLLAYANKDTDRYKDLLSKVTETLYYRKDFLIQGQNPVLKEKDYVDSITISQLIHTLQEHYYNRHITRQYSTIIIPDQNATTYDPFLVQFVKSTTDSYEALEYTRLKTLRVGHQERLEIPTFFDAILKQDPVIMDICSKKMGSISTRYFLDAPLMESIRFSGIANCVFPRTDVGSTVNNAVGIDTYKIEQIHAYNDLITPVRSFSQTFVLGHDVPSIYPVFVSEYYVLSKAFYEDSGQLSALEILVKNMILDQSIELDVLLELMNQSRTWPAKEQIYYIPILVWIGKYALTRM